MPELQFYLAPPSDRSNKILKILVAVLAILIAGVAAFMLRPRSGAEISVQKVDLYSPHTVFKAASGDNKVIGAPPSSEDDLYVVATLRITDKLRQPISLGSVSAAMTTTDGEIIGATVISPQDLPRLEQTFPALLPLVKRPIAPDEKMSPGTVHVGSVVLLFPQTSAGTWKAKKSAMLTLNLTGDRPPQSVDLP